MGMCTPGPVAASRVQFEMGFARRDGPVGRDGVRLVPASLAIVALVAAALPARRAIWWIVTMRAE